ncbi:MAG: prephenate dehydratase domain-containing protein [Candidatus Gracilibacteria bacterium]|nr:prephenate dehydratase domain-containing protein [Candidatus Gracilibacteria bacterium]
MQVAGLKMGTYTHDVYLGLGAPGTYVPQNGNTDTIRFLRENRAVGLLPKLNVYGGPVEEVMGNVWKIREAIMLGYFPLKIKHVLAGNQNGSIEELLEIRAHPQALMQCSLGLKEIGANPEELFSEAYKTPNLYESSQIILEIEDKPGSLSNSLEVFSRNGINLLYLHSTPYDRNKYRFYILIDESDLDKVNSETLRDELLSVGGSIVGNNLSGLGTEKIILTKTKTNVDGIPDAKINPSIGVICSKETALKQGLRIYKDPFCPPDNETHFSVVSTMKNDVTKEFKGLVKDKIMGLLTLPDKTGALSSALKIISESGLSLSFIMSLANNMGGFDFPLVMDNSNAIFGIQKNIIKLGGNLRVL